MKGYVVIMLLFSVAIFGFGQHASAEMRMEFRTVYLNALEQVDKGITKADVAKLFEAVPDLTELEKGYVSLVVALLLYHDATKLPANSIERRLQMLSASLETHKLLALTLTEDVDETTSIVLECLRELTAMESKAQEIFREETQDFYAPEVVEFEDWLTELHKNCAKMYESLASIGGNLLESMLAKAGDDETRLDAVVSNPQDIKYAMRLNGECVARAFFYKCLLDMHRNKADVLLKDVSQLIRVSEGHLNDASYLIYFALREEIKRIANDRLNEQLKKSKITCNFKGSSLKDVVACFSSEADINIRFDVRVDKKLELTLKLTDVSVPDALDKICNKLNLQWSTFLGYVMLYSKDKDRVILAILTIMEPQSPEARAKHKSRYNDQLPLWKRKICLALSEKTTVKYVETPFSEITAQVERLSGIKVVFMDNVTQSRDAKITLSLPDFEIGDLLTCSCRIAGLEYRIEKTGIVIYDPAKGDD